MAESLVVGALLSGVFNVLLERLTPEQAELINFICGKKLDDKLLNHLRPSLFAARAVLDNAELRQFNKDQAVKDWLDELKDAAYDLEDLLDEISTRAAAQKKVRFFSFASLSLRHTSIANRLEAIADRIEHIVGHKDALNLEKSSGTETLSWRPLTSHVRVSGVYGRKEDKEEIIKLMFTGENDQLLSVIPIVGMGGVGKTTLAQLVLNDERVKKQNFDHIIWVCVSEVFDLLKIAQTMIKSISPNFICDNMDFNLLELHLTEKLERKKFLVVLDDIWNLKYSDWIAMKNLLLNGVEGCKVLVTTRQESVARMVKTIPSFYPLDVLSDKHCLSIFAAHAFRSRDSTMHSCLEEIGRDVVSMCKGLPLAAIVLGGLFRSKPNSGDWNNILKDAMWDSMDNEIIPALKVSYYYLPSHLKQCFAYCSLFPNDYRFDKEELILMWMSEGFLHSSNENMTLEEVGSRYFDDLTSRSFFQILPEIDEHSGFGKIKTKEEFFVMHDLIHELASHVAGDFYLRLGENGKRIGHKTRHLSCNFQNYPYLDHKAFRKSKGLRTFIGINFFYIPKSIGNTSRTPLLNLRYLRTLSLRDLFVLKVVPQSIGEFIHLRYLDLSSTQIESVPDSICKLYNLQTLKLCNCILLKVLPRTMHDLVNLRHLDLSSSQGIVSLPDSLCKLCNLQTLRLRSCWSLQMLPSDMRDLVNLRHLDVRYTFLREMPRGLGNLKYLQLLSDFIVGRGEGIGIGELGGIPNLKGWTRISRLENVKNGNEAYEARMKEKKHIKSLTLSWSNYVGDVEDSRTDGDILGNLQPHQDFEALEIEGYRGTSFPDWLGSPSYHKMTWLQLSNCRNCRTLPPLGQLPALKELHISGLEGVVSIGDELLKGNDSTSSMIPFPSLEFLDFIDMHSWEQWHSIDMQAFPKLLLLTISNCPKLAGNLPRQLLSLEILKIDRCPLLSSHCMPMCPKLQIFDINESEDVAWQEQELPPSLCMLLITRCQMLESMLESLYKLSHLELLIIDRCFTTMPRPMIHLPPSLQHLVIRFCKNVDFVMSSSTAPLPGLHCISINSCDSLKFISDDMEGLLPNLRKLDIENTEAFPEGIIVPSLRELHIKESNKLLSSQAEKWHLLNNITYLRIHTPDYFCSTSDATKCFPEGRFLPPTLTTLELHGFEHLEALNCTGLQHLNSLQQLKIMHCPKLKKISGEKLPCSLRKLHIWECPLLEKKYHNKDKQLLRQISHVPIINLFQI